MKSRTAIFIFSLLLVGLSFSKVKESIDDVLRQSLRNKNDVLNNLRKSNDQHVKRLFVDGFDRFASSSTVEYMEKVDVARIGAFANYLAGTLGIPGDKRKDFINTVQVSTFMDRNEWKDVGFTFNVGNGQARCISFVAALDSDTNKLDVMVFNISASFKVLGDITVTSYTKKSAWGLFSKKKVKFIRNQAKITQSHSRGIKYSR